MTPEPIAGVSHVSLSVRNLDVSLEFSCDVLGLEVFVQPFEGTAFDGREAMLRVGRVVLCLQAHRENDGSSFDPTHTDLDHLAFHLPTREQLERWDQHLDRAAAPLQGNSQSTILLPDPTGSSAQIRPDALPTRNPGPPAPEEPP